MTAKMKRVWYRCIGCYNTAAIMLDEDVGCFWSGRSNEQDSCLPERCICLADEDKSEWKKLKKAPRLRRV